MSDALPDTVPPRLDRDSRGLFQPGHRLGGRKPGVDFRAVAEQRASIAGIDLGDALFEVFVVQLEAARKGDLGASKFVFDLISEKDPLQLQVTQTDAMTDAERGARVEELLRAAIERRRAAKLEGNGLTTP